MDITNATGKQWNEIKEIYYEAFPKSERKPFFLIRRSVKKGKAQLLAAAKGGVLQGFIMATPYRDMVMVDYLAVSGSARSHGTGSKILQEVCRRFAGKRIVLLIETPEDAAPNAEQRTARRKFYLKNGFTSPDIHVTGYSGNMDVLNYGGAVSLQEYMDLQRYALGNLMFRLSGMKPAS